MTLASIIEGNTLFIQVSVKEPGGAAKDLTGATIEASARRASVSVAADSAQVSDPAGGLARVGFHTGALSRGKWRLEVRIAHAGEVQSFTGTVVVGATSFP